MLFHILKRRALPGAPSILENLLAKMLLYVVDHALQ